MTCRSHNIVDEMGRSIGMAITCSRGERTKKCKQCGERAELLCDFELGGTKRGKTCDAPLCRRCAIEVGPDRHLCRPHDAIERANASSADQWLAEVMKLEDAAVDRGALDTMFPNWAAEPAPRSEPEQTSGSLWQREDGSITGVRKKSMHPDWIDPVDTHDWDGDSCTRCGMDAHDFETGERDTCQERIRARRDVENARLWAQQVKDENAKRRGELEQREAAAHAQPTSAKVAHVKRAGQTRNHTCHWPQCGAQVPPAMWGCKRHWYMLPKYLRDRIWHEYRAGQETTLTPSRAYLDVAHEVEAWIIANHFPQRRAMCGACGGERTVDDYMRRTPESQFTARPNETTDLYYCGCQDDPDEPHLEP